MTVDNLWKTLKNTHPRKDSDSTLCFLNFSLISAACVCLCMFFVFNRNLIFYSKHLFFLSRNITKSWGWKFALNGIVTRARSGKRYHTLKLQITFLCAFLAHHINTCPRMGSASLWYLSTGLLSKLPLDDRFLSMAIWKTFTQQLFFHQLQYFLLYAVKHSGKDRHNNERNKVVIKPLKIFSFTKVTVYQGDTVKSSWGNWPIDWEVFSYDIREQST